jgi:hypothetical protein
VEQIVEYIVNKLVENKEAVKVEMLQQNETDYTINVYVDDNDMGRVIGKGGKIANAIRAIVKSASANTGKRYFVKIGEKEA